MEDKKFTPEMITSLKRNEVFVFGSNLNGHHAGGAARIAHEKFGAEWGVGEGLMGKTYALPTLNREMKCVSIKALTDSFIKLFKCVKEHPELTFYLTKVGCGIAGWSVESMKRIFWQAVETYCNAGMGGEVSIPENLIIPQEFHENRAERIMNDIRSLEALRNSLSIKAHAAGSEEEREHVFNEIRDLESTLDGLREELEGMK